MTLPYQNPELPVDERVADLLGRMTLDEKLAQMTNLHLPDYRPTGDDSRIELPADALTHGVASVGRIGLHCTSRQAAEAANTIQRTLITKTRLGIPAFIIDEALHGLMATGTTCFPQAIGLASTWDPALIERVFRAVGTEARLRGTNWALSPVLDLARDPRWGRTEETYGEDPFLTAQLGVAAVQGLQGGDGSPVSPDGVLATAKHFAVHGQPESGTNCGPGNYAEREIRTVFLEPFRAVFQEGGARSVMASYNEINAIPSHINRWLLHDVLREEWGFDGMVISDGGGINDLVNLHKVASDPQDAAAQALRAGIDFELDNCFTSLKALVLSGTIPESRIDQAVSRVLREKFLLGLFEKPYTDPDRAEAVVASAEHIALALEAARKTIVLLKNEPASTGRPVLPLDAASLRRVAVIGPNAATFLQGGYSFPAEGGVSVLDGIRQYLGNRVEVLYAEGCRITEEGGGWESWWKDTSHLPDPSEETRRITEAVETARQAEVAILVLGENEAICREGWNTWHLGDRDSLDLIGQQEALLQAVVATGTPTVLLLFNGRPISIRWAAEHVPAILECWYLGQQGGTAVAEVLFGETTPGGRLPITFPRSVGQIPAYYYHKPSGRRGYLFSDNSPLFPFGHGLSYTTFEYSDLKITPETVSPGQLVQVSVTVSNIGERLGDEVVQLYLRDCISSVTRPVKELKGFERLTLQPGERRPVTFNVTPDMLRLLNADMEWVVEPGDFEIAVGGSSVGGLSGRFTVIAE